MPNGWSTISRIDIIFSLAVWLKQWKYSPKVLLGGGKPIECLDERMMRCDEKGTDRIQGLNIMKVSRSFF